jgi:CubicO group peptidase (beta-lactamase class C family)
MVMAGSAVKGEKLDTSSAEGVMKLSNKLSSYASYAEADKIIDGFLKKWKLAGATVAICKDGRLVYAKGFGYADREKKIAASPTNTFRVASVSKLITAIAIMKLVEEGKLSVDAKVFGKEGILKDDKFCKIKDKRVFDITVKQLMIHEGGWHSKYGDQMFMPHYIARHLDRKLPVTDEDIIEFGVKKGLHFTPGTANSYSNLGYAILGKVIERVSGMKYDQYVIKKILNPLNIYGMHITSNSYENRAASEVKYYDVPGSKKRLSVYSHTKYAPRTYEGTDFETLGAAGGWAASASQLLKLISAVDGHSYGEDIITCNTIDSMTILPNPDKFGYGWVHSDNMGNWWRTGTLCGTSAFVMRRCDGISFAFVTNTSTVRGNKFAYDIKKVMETAIGTVNWWPKEDLFSYLTTTEKSLAAGK